MTRFTGGDHLKPEDGLKYYIHKTMMVNELAGGKGAYQISNAQNAASGPSFGPIQYDIGSNKRGQNLLEQVAREAKDSQGHRFLSDNDIKQMQAHLYKPFNKMSASDKHVYQNLRPKLSQALASEDGMELVNQDYNKILDKKANDVAKIADGISNANNKQFVQSSMQAQVFIADIKNQYGDEVNGALKRFLNQSSEDAGVKLPGGRVVKVRGDLDMEDLKNFRMNTVYGVRHPADAKRRDNNIGEVTAPTRSRQQSATTYEEVHALIQGLINDKDGSFAKKLLADNQDIVDAFDARVQASVEQDKQRQMQTAQVQEIERETVTRSFGRSFG
ncbi:hypothetical protein [Neisseria weixii]|uniref:hypothetical protein n=1 Tax=Neisseria weixii TaxID=1853276 RepID=UPI0035A15FF1